MQISMKEVDFGLGFEEQVDRDSREKLASLN